MTRNDDGDRKALALLADSIVEDLLNTSDEDILAEFQAEGGDPEQHAAEMRASFEKMALEGRKKRMADAAAGAAASSGRAHRESAKIADMATARERLRSVVARLSSDHPLTLAARNENELSDADVLVILEDLEDLGVIDAENDDPKD